MGIQTIPAASGGLTVSDLIGADKIELIEEYKSTSNVTSITFSIIPQTYSKLLLVGNAITTANDNTNIRVRPNSDSTSGNYQFEIDFEEQGGSGSHIFTTYNSGRSEFQLNQQGNNASGNIYSFRFEILNYTTTAAKLVNWTTHYTPTGGYNRSREIAFGSYRSGSTTNAVTSLNILTQSGSSSITIPSAVNASLILFGVK